MEYEMKGRILEESKGVAPGAVSWAVRGRNTTMGDQGLVFLRGSYVSSSTRLRVTDYRLLFAA
jgi:hypothetical protein